MATTANRQDFIARTRSVAALFIKASDAFGNLGNEMAYSDVGLPTDEGGLGPDDFFGVNADLTADDILLFYGTLAALLGTLTPEQKKVIYATKGSSQNILPPGI